MIAKPRSVSRAHSDEEHWIPLSDLMTGLMFLFLIIALAYMVQVDQQSRKIKNVAVLYDQTRTDLYRDLDREFHGDLSRWHAQLTSDLAIRFTEPDVLFQTGSDRLQAKFQAILDDFFPRYVRILTSTKYRSAVTEVRIEGHTSSVWHAGATPEEAYIGNMALSQGRTRSVLSYILSMQRLRTSEGWLTSRVTANGLSSSHLVLDRGREDGPRSQRVEFRVRTNAEARIQQILETAR
jgi:outer membrane protein OmpA-like peptidoglycan-associated protein